MQEVPLPTLRQWKPRQLEQALLTVDQLTSAVKRSNHGVYYVEAIRDGKHQTIQIDNRFLHTLRCGTHAIYRECVTLGEKTQADQIVERFNKPL